ncbi:dolichol kinase [Aethina tumida]|uniref:dolichol kinase n=1 Tax=Aethina tumida TaxID=116153 RepID=UPI002148F988|nr:dolichol kinase [Aethina tumida]
MSNLQTYFRNAGIVARPNANDGLWLMFLLPAAVITSAFNHPIVLTPTYKLVSVSCLGLICSSIVFIHSCLRGQKLGKTVIWDLPIILTVTAIFHLYIKTALIVSILSTLTCTLIYRRALIFMLKKFPQSFTIGEASLITQALVILLYATGLNLFYFVGKMYTSNMQISTLIIQVGLLGIGTIAGCCYLMKPRSPVAFYTMASLIVCGVIFLPLHVLLNRSPLLWIIQTMFYDMSSIKLVLYWSFCSGTAVLAISNQIYYAKKASTSQRKVFHLLAVSVFVPGLLFKCSFLYLSSGVVLGIFFALELIRILKMPPLDKFLENGFAVFVDEKDVGVVAFTPLYLLAGCSLPMWLHPAPCDVTDSAMFCLLPLLSGLLTIGVGDTAASVVGSNYGKHKWKDSPKSIEGTVACVLSQALFVIILVYFGWLKSLTVVQHVKIAVAIVATSIIEAKTTQVDNLVLPLVMYTILI